MTTPLSFLFGNKLTNVLRPTIRSSRDPYRQRRGISPVIATTIILAITITLGLALWGFANSGVGTATVKYSEAVNEYGDIVRNHRFVIANIDFNNPSANKAAFWIYNNGKIDATISATHVILTCKDCATDPASPSNLAADGPDPTNLIVTPKTLQKFYFDTSLESGKTYELTVVSDEGLVQTYVKKSD